MKFTSKKNGEKKNFDRFIPSKHRSYPHHMKSYNNRRIDASILDLLVLDEEVVH
jgi:hypothetical protein